ncbi:MAG: aminotransferase class I/II-fold pyridoxal phosphate-dependent enzyme [Deltaproteobacteria bacterium]|nr:aminotransferase class I/II-fold pyridoxal phosphate-dependent enzyme [Deltaproteobacteria bacterium]
MRPVLSRRLTGFGTTIFTEITRLANQHGAVNLGQGFPDFDGPEFVKEAAIRAIREGQGQYARMAGIPPLTAALAAKYRRDWALDYDADAEITVTSGATEAIWCAIQGLVDVGDEVVIFEPYYDSYKASILNAGGIPRAVTLQRPAAAGGRWHFDPDALRAAVNERTRVILLNSPHNPTGKVFTREELSLVAELALHHDLVVVSDEVYEHLVYDGQHVSIASLPGMRERTVVISSLGKTFSLTGWKIGWACAPRALTAAVRAAHQFVTFATATPLQHGAVAAIEAPRAYYDDLLAGYRARLGQLAGGLEAAGLEVYRPEGTYFIAAGIERFGRDDVAFVKHLVEHVGIAAIPPSVFYDRPAFGRDWVRFAFCKKESTIAAALERLPRLVQGS